MRILILILCVAVFMQMAAIGQSDAEDFEQIAVIEDTFGNILPNMGICDNMAYSNGLCLTHAGPAFYAQYGDNYDVLVFFSAKAINAMYDPKIGLPVQADVQGIGFDSTPWNYSVIGSAGRLLQVVALGTLTSMPDDPDDLYPNPPFKGIEVLAHEIGHHWMAYAAVNHDDDAGDMDILRGYFNEAPVLHWSSWFNNPSVMYGGILTDNGGGSFTDINGPRKFTELDQYLMGLRTPQEVGLMWYVKVGYSQHGCSDYPLQPGVPNDFEGERVDFGIDDIIRANGPRDPATSPCHLKVAFALVHAAGTPPTTEQLAKVETYRTAIEVWWPTATDNRGSLDTSLDGCGTGTEQCPGDTSPQCEAPPDGDTVDGDAADGDTEESIDGDGDEETAEIDNPDGDSVENSDGDSEAIIIPDGDGNLADGDDGVNIDGDYPVPTDGYGNGTKGGSSGSCNGAGAVSSFMLFILVALYTLRRKRLHL